VKNRLSVSYVSRSAPHYDKLTINLLIGSSRLVDHDAATVVAQVPSSIHQRITLKLFNRTVEHDGQTGDYALAFSGMSLD
jgi:hypothetical protein